MKVKEIMKTDIITIHKDLSCKEAARILLENKITGAPVVDDEGKVVGVFSEKDIFRALFPSYREFFESPGTYLDFEKMEEEAESAAVEKKVEEIMKKNYIVATPDAPVLKVGAQMIVTGFHRVPVLEGGKLVGMVTRHEIYQAILKKYFGLEKSDNE
jgi:CBS domain-containing protein